MTRRRLLALYLVFVALFLATRLPVLLSSPNIFRGAEERARGVLPLHLDQGLLMPFYKYQFDEYNGGGMLAGLLAYPFYRVWGPTYFSLKVPALIFSWLLFTLLFGLAWRFFGATTAIFVGFVFLFAPAHYLERSLVSYFNHLEVGTVIAAALLLFLYGQYSAGAGRVRRRLMWAAAFGLVSGFGVYFMYDYLLFLGVLGLMYLASVRTWRFALAEVAVFSAAFYLGLLPWMIFHDNYLVVDYFYKQWSFPAPAKEGSFNRLDLFLQAITLQVFRWFGSHDFAPRPGFRVSAVLFDVSFGLVFLGAWLGLAWRHRDGLRALWRGWRPWRREPVTADRDYAVLPLIVYVPIHLVAFALHKYAGAEPLPPTRYLHALFPFFFLLVAYLLATLWTSGRRWVVAVLLVVIGTAGAGGSWYYYAHGAWGESLWRPGYDYQYFMETMHRHYSFFWDYDDQRAFAEATFPNHADDYTIGAAAAIGFLNGYELDGHLDAAARAGAPALAAFVAGMGVARDCLPDVHDTARLAALRQKTPSGYEPFFAIGAAKACRTPTTSGQ